MLIYNIVIEEFLLAIKKLHGLVEIWAAIDISYLKNPHPSIYWSGKFMTQSYTWKLKRSTQYSSSTSLYLNIESDPFISDWVLVKIPSAQTHRAAQHVLRAQTHRAAQHVPKTQTHRAAQHVPRAQTHWAAQHVPRWQIGRCQVIIQKAWPWTTVDTMFEECHDLYTYLVAVKSCWVSWPIPSLIFG